MGMADPEGDVFIEVPDGTQPDAKTIWPAVQADLGHTAKERAAHGGYVFIVLGGEKVLVVADNPIERPGCAAGGLKVLAASRRDHRCGKFSYGYEFNHFSAWLMTSLHWFWLDLWNNLALGYMGVVACTPQRPSQKEGSMRAVLVPSSPPKWAMA